ncbi:MAG: N-acetyltransferase [Limnohabitans sp.]|nr:N-acetyltransferase [Limnohabitans sp.]
MIHPSAVVSPRAKLGENVQIGAFCLIHDDVEIGDNCEIQAYCELGVATPLAEGPLLIGSNSLIRSHSVFYRGSVFGEGLRTGHRVTVRELIQAGKDLQIGTLSDLQGHAQIGHHVRLHSNVHIGQKSHIADFVWIFPYVVLTNDPHPPSHVCVGPTIEAYAAIATMSVILPGVRVGEGALVGAHSSVARDVAPHTVVAGNPAKFITQTSNIKLKDGSNEPAYPWTRHFHRGYPPEVVARWLNGEDYAKT